jgi:plastocyanin
MMKGHLGTMVGVAVALSLCAGAAQGYEAGPVANGGSISGSVKFQGTAPPRKALEVTKDKEVCGKHEILNEDLIVGPNGGLENAVVSITNISKGKAFESKDAVLDQEGCTYKPHVLLMAPGTVKINNDDGILHNIHTYSTKNPPINRAQPKFKKTIEEKFEQPEVIKVTCDAHGWMQGWLIVMDTPYYAKTDANGAFKLTDVPPGDYEIKVWHGKLGEQTQKVTVPGGGAATVDFSLAQK